MTQKNSKAKTIAYWLTTVFGPASFAMGGSMFLLHAEQPVSQMARLGLPSYLLYILGFWKLAGAVVVLLPKLPLLKEWVYAGLTFLLTGAFATHLLAGDPLFAAGPGQAAPPLIFLVLVLASWALRPASRRLPGTEFWKKK